MIGALKRHGIPPHLARNESVGFWDRVLIMDGEEPAVFVIPPQKTEV